MEDAVEVNQDIAQRDCGHEPFIVEFRIDQCVLEGNGQPWLIWLLG